MATATIISYPEALCMAGNMLPVRVSAAGLFTFRLKKGSTVLLEEDYVPDASGQAEIDIRDLVLSDLSLSLPSADVFKQTAAAASYTISTDTDSRSFKAVLGGIDRPATDAATFLKMNFLTWQPQLKSVTYGQPEWLSFYTPATAVSLKAKFYLKDGTTSTVTVAAATSFDPGCVYSVNVRFSRLWSMGEGDRYGMVDVWLEDDQSTALTYVQRYVLDTSGDERTVLVARNSLGGIDTFSFLGSMERSAEAEHTNVMRGETMYSGLVDMTRTYTVNTGILSGHGRDWVWDLQRSTQAWVLMDGALRGIVMLAPAVTASMYEDSTGTVDFLLCDDSGYLNMPRMESLPEDIEVPGPDGEVFFLAPRLADYPDASLDDSLLLPVQSPAAQEWSKLSVGALSSYILSAVDDKYGEFLHVHDNLQVLGKLSVDDNGRLMYDGSPVGGSGLTEHDHHGETIRPDKIVVGTVEITCVDGRLHVSSTVTSDGDFVAFGDEEGGEAGGGLDVARLWEELKAEDGTKVIDVSHMPSDVVLQDKLISTLSKYVKTTEMNTALAGKADKDWVEEELTKYVTIAGNQDITGVKTFVNGIKIGSISLSVVDGRLHVSSTVTSDGDFVAFGDEEGSTGSGGLDVARLWDELRAIDSSKVIDVSHIPNITKAKISDFPTKWAWADISGKPSTFTPSAHSHAISDVTGLQGELNSKWVWSESQVKAVKVNSAVSADNADTLDGIHANGLLTALTSSADTNLSITVGGKPLSVADLYAKYADQLLTARKINGTSFNGAYDITTDKWGMARLVSIKDYTEDNAGATKSVDGSAGFSLLLPQSIKVKTLDVDGVTLSVVDGRLHISATATSAGDFVAYGDEAGSSGSGSLDVARLWQELEAKNPSKVIDLSHIPAIPTSKITGLDSSLASYAKKDGSNASGTWGINISGNAATADVSNYLFLNPNNGTHASQNDAVPANGRFAIYDVNAATTAGGNDGYIMAFRWPSSNFATQVFLDADSTGIMALRHRSSTNAWTDWYRILHSGNIGSYALTPSNYASTLDSRYVNASGDTMLGRLIIDTSVADLLHIDSSHATQTYLNVRREGTNKAAFGYYDGRGSFMYNWVGGYYFELTDGGGLQLHKEGTLLGNIWHSGIDGSGSGLDADLLDGVQLANIAHYKYITANSSIYDLDYNIGFYARDDYPSGAYYNEYPSGYGAYLSIGHPSDRNHSAIIFFDCPTSNALGSVYVRTRGAGDRNTKYAAAGKLAYTTDNVYSATKLQTSRTIWGRPFNGEGNVSGDMTGVGSISMSGSISGFSELLSAAGSGNRRTSIDSTDFAIVAATTGWAMGLKVMTNSRDENLGWVAGAYGSGDSISNYYFYGGEYTSPAMVIKPSSGNVGIGTTSPVYKLDVAGQARVRDEFRCDYWLRNTVNGRGLYNEAVDARWYASNDGWHSDKDVRVGGSLIVTDKLYIPSPDGNQRYYIKFE